MKVSEKGRKCALGVSLAAATHLYDWIILMGHRVFYSLIKVHPGNTHSSIGFLFSQRNNICNGFFRDYILGGLEINMK